MIAKVHASGKSFRGAVSYCLEEKRMDRDHAEEKTHIGRRVEWTTTLNLATDDPRRAARQMAATAHYSTELKRLAGIGAGGRKLEKPVAHYTLSWARGQVPDRQQQEAAVSSSLKALGLEDRQAVVVSHRDGATPHVHVIVNRVSPEDGRAAGMGKDRIKLSEWAETYEREQGHILCKRRVAHNEKRRAGHFIKDRTSVPNARFYRRWPSSPSPFQDYDRWQKGVRQQLDQVERAAWHELLKKQEQQRSGQVKDSRTVWGRVREWRQRGEGLLELTRAAAGNRSLLQRWSEELESQHRRERAELGRHQRAEGSRAGVYRDRSPRPVYSQRETKPDRIQIGPRSRPRELDRQRPEQSCRSR